VKSEKLVRRDVRAQDEKGSRLLVFAGCIMLTAG